MPAHLLDKRGVGKTEKRSAAVKCRTCPASLSRVDLKDGCRRCLTCRKSQPGRPVKPQEGPGTRTDRPDWLTVKSKPVTPKPTESWWLDPACQDRATFQAAVNAHSFSGGRKENPIAISPGGYRDV